MLGWLSVPKAKEQHGEEEKRAGMREKMKKSSRKFTRCHFKIQLLVRGFFLLLLFLFSSLPSLYLRSVQKARNQQSAAWPLKYNGRGDSQHPLYLTLHLKYLKRRRRL